MRRGDVRRNYRHRREHMKRSEHYAEAVRLLDEANHVGHTDELRGLGMMMAANAHATLASIEDLARLQEAANRLT
ncbi:hypothetical protein SEA_ARCHIE_108 [Mycobacterium phage Archie]|uniref:Uncharacterized protein n=1 Tax=Mycobacterium phage Archie TaxID=1718599 RepID=A0A0M3UK99_9CAUD|nr:hypothetical protein AVU85_gp126 [Mycobacterium phage Archie]ALF00411.1 hypothetical protein SEA_ARCHIE_108 [Mycobacterium phage Archie]